MYTICTQKQEYKINNKNNTITISTITKSIYKQETMFTSYSITGQSTYLSDIAVHLFLQTSLSVNEIQDKMTNGTDSGGELLEEYQSPSVHGGCTSLSRSCSAYEDHDSGFSYSTASSLNDCGKSYICFILFHYIFHK